MTPSPEISCPCPGQEGQDKAKAQAQDREMSNDKPRRTWASEAECGVMGNRQARAQEEGDPSKGFQDKAWAQAWSRQRRHNVEGPRTWAGGEKGKGLEF